MIPIDFYSNHNYDENNKKLFYVRGYGLFSNITVLMILLCKLKERDIIPHYVHTNLLNYNNEDLYNFFYINNTKIKEWEEFNKEQVNKFSNVGLNLYGFGSKQSDVDINVTNCLLDVYFNISNKVKEQAEDIIKKYNINTETDTFVWWRKCDKINEINWINSAAKYPEIEDALKYISPNTSTFVQTDDKTIFNDFLNYPYIKLLDILPLSEDGRGTHVIGQSLTEEEYIAKYNITKKDNLLKLIALVYIASKCKKFIGYPGNISLFVCLLRRSFDNVVFFKNREELY
jgi:hypothetical protein